MSYTACLSSKLLNKTTKIIISSIILSVLVREIYEDIPVQLHFEFKVACAVLQQGKQDFFWSVVVF